MKTGGNLFENIPCLSAGEEFTKLLECKNVVIERIVSSEIPDNKVYCQTQDEWVILIKGSAQLKINDSLVQLQSGDYIFIPSNTPHQVIKTSQNCLWLAVHIY